MLVYNGGIAKRVARRATLEQMLIRTGKNEVVSQFYVRPAGAELFATDVIFTEGLFNVSRVVQDRIVLGIRIDGQTTNHICLVFADEALAPVFSSSISSYIQRGINMRSEQADALFSADLTEVVEAR